VPVEELIYQNLGDEEKYVIVKIEVNQMVEAVFEYKYRIQSYFPSLSVRMNDTGLSAHRPKQVRLPGIVVFNGDDSGSEQGELPYL
jgi:hypothetical protein